MKIFLKGAGRVEDENGKQLFNQEGMDLVEDKEPEFQNDAVSYGGGDKENPMSDLVQGEGWKEAIESATDHGKEQIAEAEDKSLLISMIKTDPTLSVSNKEGFDQTQIQDARKDTENEGGITNPKHSTGPMKSSGDPASEGGVIRREPLSDSTPGAYELSGFHVEMKTDTGMVSVQITQDFKDLETAKMAINGDKYLMPVRSGGFVPCRITRGAPIICFEERQILEFVNDTWRRP